MATTKEKLPVSGLYYVVITCRHGASVVRSLKLLAPFYLINKTVIILSTTCRYVILPYNTNSIYTFKNILILNTLKLS